MKLYIKKLKKNYYNVIIISGNCKFEKVLKKIQLEYLLKMFKK